ncbi:MAG: hypothetical protein NTY47_04400 [Candidatus Omnitrophica bacterium]|nr:hypothetical protein [Candidatus Omnitrophota bacterium]
MNKIWSCGIVFLMVLGLSTGPVVETVYANNHQDCSCCKTSGQKNAKCHDTTKMVCQCANAASQVITLKKSNVFELAFAGYFKPAAKAAYIFLSLEDIFHPPRA